jgi:hypothetical protein
MINIKEILEKEGLTRKFEGCAPEGFILVHEKTLEDLKDFDIWKSWKNNEISIEHLNKNNFENEQVIFEKNNQN